MKVEDVSYDELQLMRLKVQKPYVLARFFEGNEEENRYYILNTTVAPTTYVVGCDPLKVINLILRRGYRQSAEVLGVSVSFLKKRVRVWCDGEVLYLTGSFRDEFMEPVSEEKLVGLAERIPYLRLLETISHWRSARIKKTVSVIGNVDAKLTSSKGRKAELFYKEVRKNDILRDLNDEETNPPYDFDDKFYLKVDVKSSKQYSTKKDGNRWYFSLKGSACDYFACIGWDEFFEVPLFIMMVVADKLRKESFVIKQTELGSVSLLYSREKRRI